jgi:hypothetical protein
MSVLLNGGRGKPKGVRLSGNPERKAGASLTLSPGPSDKRNGGAVNWSSAGDWNNGVPGANSDLTIYSDGHDTGTLDVNTTLNSPTLGWPFNSTTSKGCRWGDAHPYHHQCIERLQQGELLLYGVVSSGSAGWRGNSASVNAL